MRTYEHKTRTRGRRLTWQETENDGKIIIIAWEIKKKSCLVFCSSAEPQRVNMKLLLLLTDVLVVTLRRVSVCFVICLVVLVRRCESCMVEMMFVKQVKWTC